MSHRHLLLLSSHRPLDASVLNILWGLVASQRHLSGARNLSTSRSKGLASKQSEPPHAQPIARPPAYLEARLGENLGERHVDNIGKGRVLASLKDVAQTQKYLLSTSLRAHSAAGRGQPRVRRRCIEVRQHRRSSASRWQASQRSGPCRWSWMAGSGTRVSWHLIVPCPAQTDLKQGRTVDSEKPVRAPKLRSSKPARRAALVLAMLSKYR